MGFTETLRAGSSFGRKEHPHASRELEGEEGKNRQAGWTVQRTEIKDEQGKKQSIHVTESRDLDVEGCAQPWPRVLWRRDKHPPTRSMSS